MQITIEDISPVEKRVDFEVPWGDVAPKIDKAYDRLSRQVRLKGFRPGKVPRSVVERLYKQDVEHEVARELVEQSLGQAISENQIQPVAPPSVDKLEIKSGEPFRFSARVEVRSQVVPKDYSGLPLTRRPTKVTDEEVTNALEQYRRQLTQFKPIEGRTTTHDTDVLAVDVHGKVGEHKIKNNTVMIDLSDENAAGVPGLSQHLRGVPINSEHLEIKYDIPADSPMQNLAGKAVSLHVTIKEGRERKQPALDDDFAKDTGEAETLDGLKAKIREKLAESDKERIKRELFQQIVKEIVARNSFEVAPALIDRHAQIMVSRTKGQLMMAGIDAEALDEEKMREELKGEAEQEARAGILLQAIAEREGLQVGDADVQKRIAELAAARQESPKKLRAELDKNGRIHGVRAQILEEKTLDMLLGQAKITDEDPDRLIVTPDQASAERLIVSPEEAAAEATARKPGKSPRK